MTEEEDRAEAELERLRTENAELRARLDLFAKEHRIIAWLAGLITAGPRLAKSMQDWFSHATPSNPLPVKESAAVAAAIVRRLISVGLIGLVVPSGLLIWQNILISSQNQYFREQTQELRRQIDLQEEQGDLIRRKELIGLIYDGKVNGVSMRTRVEALKALVQLDNKLIDQGALADSHVNLRSVDLSCEKADPLGCANLEESWLPRVDFRGANLKGASFRSADLTDCNFVAADISNADFSFASIEGATFRERLSAPMYTAIEVSDPVWMDDAGVSLEHRRLLLNELRNISMSLLEVDFSKSVGRDRYRKDSISFEYGLERLKLSDDLKNYINSTTKAAKLEGSKLPLSNLEYKVSIDQHSRLPIGVVPHRSVEAIRREIGRFERIDSIQSLANELFGPYQVDVDDWDGTRGNGIICVRRGISGMSEKDIEYFEGLSLRMKREFLQNLCSSNRKLRLRGGMVFRAH